MLPASRGASVLWFMVYGLWFMVYGLWFMVYGLWFTLAEKLSTPFLIPVPFLIYYCIGILTIWRLSQEIFKHILNDIKGNINIYYT